MSVSMCPTNSATIDIILANMFTDSQIARSMVSSPVLDSWLPMMLLDESSTHIIGLHFHICNYIIEQMDQL